jgi:RNA exonuclease 1
MFHSTPSVLPSYQPLRSSPQNCTKAHRDFLAARDFFAARHVRAAVALDCEMGTAISGESEIIRITMVDFFSREVLMDSLVQPSVPMKHYNTRFSGVTAFDMRNAVKNRTCIFGRDTARQQVWRFVGPGTVIVVHGGNNDLSALRLIHPLVIDTFISESYGEAVVGGRSLKNLCQGRLGRIVQNGKGHCSHEDALACRELVHWLAKQIPA